MKEKWEVEWFKKLIFPQELTKVDENYVVFVEKRIQKDTYVFNILLKDLSTGLETQIAEGCSISIIKQGYGFRLSFFKDNNLYWKNIRIALEGIQTGMEHLVGCFKNHSKALWSPDGQKLVLCCARKVEVEPSDLPEFNTMTWINRLQFKSDASGIFDGSYREVVVYDIETGKEMQLTKERRDYGNAAFLDDTHVIYTAVLEQSDTSDKADIMIYDLSENKEKIIWGPGGPITELCVSPSGREFLILSHDNHYWEATNFSIYRYRNPLEETSCEKIENPYDRSIGNYIIVDSGAKASAPCIQYGQDEEIVYFLLTSGFCTEIYRIQGEKIQRMDYPLYEKKKDEGMVILEYLPWKDGLIVIETGVNLVVRIRKNNQILWNKNVSYEEIKLVAFTYKGFDENNRIGYVMMPKEKCKGLVLDIHGGPHFCHGFAFSLDVHVLTKEGYAVVYSNPAGSQGGGEELCAASYHDWGGKDYRELLQVMDAVTNLPEFQNSKLKWAVKGGSYGGYMVNWMIGHSNRFTCAISERSTCNRYSQAGTSDCAFRYGKFEFDGLPWEHTEHYMERSPITYVKRVETPILLIHGGNDRNCSVSQSEEFYSALMQEGKEAYFALFEGQNHSFPISGNPKSREERYKLLIWWLNRYMK